MKVQVITNNFFISAFVLISDHEGFETRGHYHARWAVMQSKVYCDVRTENKCIREILYCANIYSGAYGRRQCTDFPANSKRIAPDKYEELFRLVYSYL